MPKIIQITAATREDTDILYVLFDDGTLWTRNGRTWNWDKLDQPVPLPKEVEPR